MQALDRGFYGERKQTHCVSWWTLPAAGRDGVNQSASPYGEAIKLRAAQGIGRRQSGTATEPGSEEKQM